MMGKGYFVLALRDFLGGLFVYASIHKLHDPVEFARIIYGYKILPAWAINPVAIVLPGVELVSGMFLLAGLLARGSASVIALSLAVFICALGYNIARGLEFDCGCFSFAHSTRGAAKDLLIRDIILFAMSIMVLTAKEQWFSLDGVFRPGKQFAYKKHIDGRL